MKELRTGVGGEVISARGLTRLIHGYLWTPPPLPPSGSSWCGCHEVWQGHLQANLSPWTGVREVGVPSGALVMNPPTITCSHPSEFKRKSGHRTFHLEVVRTNK